MSEEIQREEGSITEVEQWAEDYTFEQLNYIIRESEDGLKTAEAGSVDYLAFDHDQCMAEKAISLKKALEKEKRLKGQHNIQAMLSFLTNCGNLKYQTETLFGTVSLLDIKEACTRSIQHGDGNGNVVGLSYEVDSGVMTILSVFYIDNIRNNVENSWFNLFENIVNIDKEILENGYSYPVFDLFSVYKTVSDWTKEELELLKNCTFDYSDVFKLLNDFKSATNTISKLRTAYEKYDETDFKLNNCNISNRTSSPTNVLHTSNGNYHLGYGQSLDLMRIADSLLWIKKSKFVTEIDSSDGVIKFKFYQDVPDANYADFTNEVKELLSDYSVELSEYQDSLVKKVKTWYDTPITNLKDLVLYLDKIKKERV